MPSWNKINGLYMGMKYYEVIIYNQLEIFKSYMSVYILYPRLYIHREVSSITILTLGNFKFLSHVFMRESTQELF